MMKIVEMTGDDCLLYPYREARHDAVSAKTIMRQKNRSIGGQEPSPSGEEELLPGTLTDEGILEVIYRDYRDYLYSIAFAKCRLAGLERENADDCFTEIILKLSENGCGRIRKFRGESSLKTYLTVLARNLAADYIRHIRRSRVVADSLEEYDELGGVEAFLGEEMPGTTPEEQYLRKEGGDVVRRALTLIERQIARLPPEEKLLVDLRMRKNLSYREIDEFLGIDNSRYRLSRLLGRLKNSLDESTRKSLEEIITEGDYGYNNV